MTYKTTTDHNDIQRWVERLSGRPAVVKGTSNDTTFGVLRINFTNDPNLEPISWGDFFDRFESNNLAFRYTDDPEADIGPDATPEDQFTFVNRDTAPLPEDTTELPDLGDQERAEENIYPSAPADRHERPREELEEEE